MMTDQKLYHYEVRITGVMSATEKEHVETRVKNGLSLSLLLQETVQDLETRVVLDAFDELKERFRR